MASINLSRPRARDATLRVPGDKSISHRALMCASIAGGESSIFNANLGADVAATLGALRALGVRIDLPEGDAIRVRGVENFVDPPNALDCANSGSTMRMLSGVIAGRVNAVLDGDQSLRRRPMERVAGPLRQMGADVTTGVGGKPPVVHKRSQHPLHGELFVMPAASAQVKSALLFAGLRAEGETTIVEPASTRDHTERMLRAMGADIDAHAPTVTVRPSALRSTPRLRVPGDFSAAFFFVAGAAICSGSRLVIRDVGVNPTRTAALDVARLMGADIRLTNQREENGEPIADLETRGGAKLKSTIVSSQVVPNLIDEIPALCALAAFADGDFTIRGAADLRTKESDRIATTVALLRSFGAVVDEFPDGITVRGGKPLRAPTRAGTFGDHRIGMSAALLALGAQAPLEIDDADCIATSFPGFEGAWRIAFG